jgi:hypothetical protein
MLRGEVDRCDKTCRKDLRVSVRRKLRSEEKKITFYNILKISTLFPLLPTNKWSKAQ